MTNQTTLLGGTPGRTIPDYGHPLWRRILINREAAVILAAVLVYVVSCITVPGDAVRLAQLLRDRGFEVGAGYGALIASTIRIGHMGDHTVREVRALLDALDEALVALAS